jgi:hypothetical protein
MRSSSTAKMSASSSFSFCCPSAKFLSVVPDTGDGGTVPASNDANAAASDTVIFTNLLGLPLSNTFELLYVHPSCPVHLHLF